MNLEESMLLDYIYSDFILNLLLKYSSYTCYEKLSRHVEGPNVAKQLI